MLFHVPSLKVVEEKKKKSALEMLEEAKRGKELKPVDHSKVSLIKVVLTNMRNQNINLTTIVYYVVANVIYKSRNLDPLYPPRNI